jgi:beta-glucosidase
MSPGTRVAVLGTSADDVRLLYGDYSYPGRSIHIAPDQMVEEVISPAESHQSARRVATPREAMAERFELTDEVASADVAVVFVGGRSGMREEDTSGECRDASDLRLTLEQRTLIENTARSGTPTVVVVIGGRAHSLTEVVPHAAALVMAWLPGDEGSHGLVDVLAGDVDAGGRLPVSLLRTVGQVGAYPGHHHGGGRSLMYGDYIDGSVSPLFPFGHGLSYTTWRYDAVAVSAGTTADDLQIDVTLTNIGNREGEEVVQAFARDELASVGRPARQLVAFARVKAVAQGSVRVQFTIPAARLGFHGIDLQFRVEPGEFTFFVGPTSTTVTMHGDVLYPDPNEVRSFGSVIS